MIFASTTKLFKKIIKNIKQHFKKFERSSVSPNNQDLSNDTTFSQIKSHVPVPLKAVGDWQSAKLQKRTGTHTYCT